MVAVKRCSPNFTFLKVFGSCGSVPSKRIEAPGGSLRTDSFAISSRGLGLFENDLRQARPAEFNIAFDRGISIERHRQPMGPELEILKGMRCLDRRTSIKLQIGTARFAFDQGDLRRVEG